MRKGVNYLTPFSITVPNQTLQPMDQNVESGQSLS